MNVIKSLSNTILKSMSQNKKVKLANKLCSLGNISVINHVIFEGLGYNPKNPVKDSEDYDTLLKKYRTSLGERKQNDLEVFFTEKEHRVLDKWLHYFNIYDRHFSQYRGKEVTIVEIGVSKGGSMEMWKDYFGPKAKVIGVDINPDCKRFNDNQVQIFIGSQDDRDFWRKFKQEVPHVDILIDDGGHTMNQQIVTFEEMFDHIADGGTYLCEDLHTSYWKSFGGGYKKKGSFIEYSKNFIDYINAWHSHNPELSVNKYTQSMYCLHYYDSVLVIEKEINQERLSALAIGSEL